MSQDEIKTSLAFSIGRKEQEEELEICRVETFVDRLLRVSVRFPIKDDLTAILQELEGVAFIKATNRYSYTVMVGDLFEISEVLESVYDTIMSWFEEETHYVQSCQQDIDLSLGEVPKRNYKR